jgi:hypothetical protein
MKYLFFDTETTGVPKDYKAPSSDTDNWPRLQELYVKLFGHEFDDAHNAMSDIDATEQCFRELRKKGLI